jgi:RNA polymerase sigma factor (sigma-70 family)
LADPPDSFDDLLNWLDLDREFAGQKYEVIRAGLIRIFVSKGFSDAEDLADETIDRVIKRLPDIRETYKGEPIRYFRGVARNIIRERLRRKEIATDQIPEPIPQSESASDKYECLLKCLKFLSREKRELIVDYYLYQGHDKVEHHRRMAEELCISEGALRTRSHHIRAALEKCVLKCIKSLAKEQNGS